MKKMLLSLIVVVCSAVIAMEKDLIQDNEKEIFTKIKIITKKPEYSYPGFHHLLGRLRENGVELSYALVVGASVEIALASKNTANTTCF